MLKDTSIVEVNLKISCYGGEKKSNKGIDVLEVQTGAKKKDFKVTTCTVPKEITGPITKACTTLRNQFKTWGLNGRDGAIFVTRDNYPKIKERIETQWKAIDDLIQKTWTPEKYQEIVATQETNLGQLFDSTKVDSLDEIRASYSREIFPRKVDLSQLSNDPIDKDQLNGYKDRIEEGLAVLVDELKGFVERVIENMDTPAFKYKCAIDTCKNITEACRNMNIFGDVVYDQIIRKVEQIFGNYGLEDFRESQDARNDVKARATTILNEIGNIVVKNEMEGLFKEASGEDEDLKGI